MKKFLIFAAIIIVSCGQKNKKIKEKNPNDTIPESVKYLADKSNRNKQETKQNYDRWITKELLDEFGETSGKICVYTFTNGEFSNTATSGSELFIEFLFTKNKAGLLLHKYKADNAAEDFIEGGKMKMKDSNGNEISITINTDWDKKFGVIFSGSNFIKLKDFISKNTGDIKVLVTDTYRSSYNFKINSNYFNSEFSKLK
jgi:hypothetical protein